MLEKRLIQAVLCGLASMLAVFATAAATPTHTTMLPAPKQTGTLYCPHRVTVFKVKPPIFHPEYWPKFSLPVNTKLDDIPPPLISKHHQRMLTLHEAILLALRNNPDVESSELQRVVDKYAVLEARNAFEPQYSFAMTATSTFAAGQSSSPVYAMTPSVSVTSTMGTKVELGYSQNWINSLGQGTLTVTQPLLQGFGYVNRIPYDNALDQEISNRLTFKNGIITVVVGVVTAYRTLAEDFENLDIQKRNLENTEVTVRQYKLQVAAGQMAPSDLLQQEASLESARVSYEQQKFTMQQDYQALLQAIGLRPMVDIRIKHKMKISQYHIPDVKRAVCIALANNIAYQQAVLALRTTARGILTAEDARKWQFDVIGTTTVGDPGTIGGGGANDNSTLQFSLNVPIDNISNTAGVVSARVAYIQAKIQLRQTKEDTVREVVTQVNQLKSLKEQIRTAEIAVKLQKLTYKNTQTKYRYGKTTVFEVTQIQDQLLQQETDLVSTKISFLNGVTALKQLLGTTLDDWKIKLRY